MALGKGGLGKGLDALFPSNVDVDSLGGAVPVNNEKIVKMIIFFKPQLRIM